MWIVDAYIEQPVQADFRFDPSTPMLVSVTFVPRRGQHVTWHIGRELLLHGLYEDSGTGDVTAWPDENMESDVLCLVLESNATSAFLEVPRMELDEWLKATYECVSAGAEADTLDWDGFLVGILDASPPMTSE
ncbi:SsgA family sporulation/cell division regulator [Streptomyces sp. NPDC058394]|uniref:SsgA family sporulation/cell division regulator n=1 Tax=Streptomyces sp. NPDC058394 TaxID=3346477 RepID=UPI00365AAD0A